MSLRIRAERTKPQAKPMWETIKHAARILWIKFLRLLGIEKE